MNNIKQDWRITNQKNYLQGKDFIRKNYDGKDHSHCEFCWEKFGNQNSDLKSGYCTRDGRFWVCNKCFEDFKKEFNFKELEIMVKC